MSESTSPDSGGEVREKLRNATIEPTDKATASIVNTNTSNSQLETPTKNKPSNSNVDKEEESPSSEESSEPRAPRSPKRKRDSEAGSESAEEIDMNGGSSVEGDPADDKETGREVRKKLKAKHVAGDDTSGNVAEVRKRARTPTRIVRSKQERNVSASASLEGMTSPKGKRTRDDYLRDQSPESSIPPLAPIAAEKAKSVLRDSENSDSDASDRSPKRLRESPAGDEIPKSVPAPTSIHPKKVEETVKSPGKLGVTSGFGNVSATSPFAGLSSPAKKPQGEKKVATSQSAFEASSFSKLAQSTTSPFGSITGTGASGSASPFKGFGGAPATASPFGSAAGAKPSFGGFGGGSAFGSSSAASPWGAAASKPSLFGSSSIPPPITGLSNKAVRPFGAPVEREEKDDEDEDGSDEDDDDENDDGDAEGTAKETSQVPPPPPTSKSHAKPKSGEEKEITVFGARAKLYQYAGTQWKEAGVGLMKLNVTRLEDDPEDVDYDFLQMEGDYVGLRDEEEEDLIVYKNGKKKDEEKKEDKDEDEADATSKIPRRKARFILRVDASGRLVLNTAITKELTIGGDAKGSAPDGQTLLFLGTLAAGDESEKSGTVGNAATMLQVKVRFEILYPDMLTDFCNQMKPENAHQLWATTKVVQKVL
jgi:Ran-binding protein 3